MVSGLEWQYTVSVGSSAHCSVISSQCSVFSDWLKELMTVFWKCKLIKNQSTLIGEIHGEKGQETILKFSQSGRRFYFEWLTPRVL